MYEAVQNCNHCGANLTLDDMRKPNCPYCGTVYPHHAQAAQHAELMSRMMGQLVANQAEIQNQWRGAFGVGPVPPPGTPVIPGMQGTPGMPGMPGMQGTPGTPTSPYADPVQLAQLHQAHASRLARRILTIVLVSVAGVFLLVGLILALVLLR